MKKSMVLIGVCLLFLTACTKTVKYLPRSDKSVDSSLDVITQLIQEQPPHVGVVNFEVTDKYFKVQIVLRRVNFLLLSESIIDERKRINFKDIEKAKIEFKKSYWYVISIWDYKGELKCKLYTPKENLAKSVVDALYSLKSRAVR